MRKFTYTPLASSQSTRLFKFIPSELTADISCELFEHGLENSSNSTYTALSYCWGSLKTSHSITLNDAYFHVTANLHSALEVLRVSHSTSLFWIDAICIDQLNLHERSLQVRNMRRIYEQASKVIIWLGSENETTTAAMHWIERLCCFYKRLNFDDTADKLKLYDLCMQNINNIFESSGGVIDFTPLRGLSQLLSSPWFERVWIVQEATTAPNKDMYVHCGSAVVSWESLITATEIITHLMWRPELRSFFVNSSPIDNQSLRRLFNLEKQRQYEKPTLSFLQILAKYRYFKATDRRDKIYALRGLAADLLEDEIIPDYSLSFQKVSIQLAEHFLISKRSFECLAFCDYSERNSGHPSWVPDWSSKTTRHPLAKRPVHDSLEEVSPVYKAGIVPTTSGKSQGWRCSIVNGLLLNVAGFRVDIVDRTARFEVSESSPSPGASSVKLGMLGNEPAIHKIDLPESEMYRNSSETLRKAYSRTIVADLAKLGNIRARGFGINLEYWRDVEDYTIPPAEARYRKEWGSLLFSITGRSLFWSQDGYLGLGPVDVETGDHICVFLGADVLYLLRPVEEAFVLIGECYVHGMMDGEAFSLLDDGLRRIESLSIA